MRVLTRYEMAKMFANSVLAQSEIKSGNRFKAIFEGKDIGTFEISSCEIIKPTQLTKVVYETLWELTDYYALFPMSMVLSKLKGKGIDISEETLCKEINSLSSWVELTVGGNYWIKFGKDSYSRGIGQNPCIWGYSDMGDGVWFIPSLTQEEINERELPKGSNKFITRYNKFAKGFE